VFSEPAQHRSKIEATVGAWRRDQEHAGFAKLVGAANVGIARDEDHRPLRVLRSHDFGCGWSARVRVDDDAQGIPSFDLANGERGVVREHGPDPDEDRVRSVPQAMYLPQRGLARQVPAPGDRDAPVDGDGELQKHGRPSALDARQESRVQAFRLFAHQALFDRDAVGAHSPDPFAVGARIGIADGHDDTRDSGVADRVDAGRREAVVRARFEIRVQRRAARGLAGFPKRVDLRVRLACRVVVALADDRAVSDDDCPDEWVRARPPRSARGEAKRSPHVPAVQIGHGC